MPFQHKYSIQQQKQFMKQNKYINHKNKSQNKVQDRKEKKIKKKKKMFLVVFEPSPISPRLQRGAF